MLHEELWLSAHGFHHTNTQTYTLSMPQDSFESIYIHIYIYCLCNVQRLQSMFKVTYVSMFVWLCMSLSNDCTVLNKQKQAFALMKGCCHLFCRSATIRVPCGSSDRLFFCMTLNLRVQGINLTLLGETKEGPLTQYNSARMETWVVSATATCYNIITPAQQGCQNRKCM